MIVIDTSTTRELAEMSGGWSTQFVHNSSKFLYIIHDKRDTSKTAIPECSESLRVDEYVNVWCVL